MVASFLSISQELFDQICEDCDRRTLASLARTHRAFTYASLAALWRVLPSLAPLVCVLSSDAIACTMSPYPGLSWIEQPLLSLKRELTPTDLERFHFYAPLVEQLLVSYPAKFGANVPPDVWRVVARARAVPLPNLRRVTVHEQIAGDRPTFTCVPFLIGAKLKELCICLTSTHVAAGSDRLKTPFSELLASLPRRCPQLAHLKLSVVQPTPYMADAVADAICGVPQLVSLTIEGIPLLARAFTHLRSSPSLRSLTIDVQSTDDLEGGHGDDDSADSAFPALSTLSITTNSMGRTGSLIRFARPPHLTSLEITILGNATLDDFSTLTGTIASLPSYKQLEHLVIRISQPVPTARVAFVSLPPAAIEPLHALSALRTFAGHCHAPLDDAAFLRMALAWPHIEDLSLFAVRCSPGNVSLAGLVEFRQLCGSLRSIEVELANVDHDECTALLARLRPLATHKSIEPSRPSVTGAASTIVVGTPSIEKEDVDAVIEILSIAFPTGVELRHCWYPSDDEDEDEPEMGGAMFRRWEDVSQGLRDRIASRK
ncbi:hypothetical protein FKP32DRAFT_1644425 [Trametes sanguinea]|nr:hypothetical protein FKP32DRAFT_1644425 [Trametes sanguinea]